MNPVIRAILGLLAVLFAVLMAMTFFFALSTPAHAQGPAPDLCAAAADCVPVSRERMRAALLDITNAAYRRGITDAWHGLPTSCRPHS